MSSIGSYSYVHGAGSVPNKIVNFYEDYADIVDISMTGSSTKINKIIVTINNKDMDWLILTHEQKKSIVEKLNKTTFGLTTLNPEMFRKVTEPTIKIFEKF